MKGLGKGMREFKAASKGEEDGAEAKPSQDKIEK
jgi:Sec-independent protein translocase protein TatA